MSHGIGLGKYAVGRDVKDDWVIYGLGSCIGLILCDSTTHVLAMAHIVLPASPKENPPEPARYADTAIPHLLEEMKKLGALTSRIVAKIAGGARMLQISGLVGDIGARNLEAVREGLARHRIPLIAECVGGTSGRTLRWNAEKRLAIVSQYGAPDHILTPVGYCGPVGIGQPAGV